jgi:AcrR family transcriptional regulator
MPEAATDHRRAIAERNIAAIVDAAEALLARGDAATTTAVAAEASLSRVTVYAHFPTRAALLEAVAERVVARAVASLEEAGIADKPPLDALDALVELGWREIDRNRAVAAAAAEGLGREALMRAHDALHAPIAALVERGRADGVFRTDLPVRWLVAAYFALAHAYGDEVRAGVLDAEDAVPTIRATVRSVWAPADSSRA